MSKTKIFRVVLFLFVAAFFIHFSAPVAVAITHPHVVYNPLEIEDLKNRIKEREEPLTSHYSSLKSIANSSTSGNNLYVGNDPKFYREGLDIDGPAMFSHAMLYALDKNEANASRARDLLLAWTNSLTQVNTYEDFSDASNNKEAAAMFLSRAMFQIVPAYDLIYDSSALSSQDKSTINGWLRKNATLITSGMDRWFNSGSPMPCHNYSNHVSADLTGLMLIGYMLEVDTLTNNVISGDSLSTNWQKFLEKTIYMQGDPVIGCDQDINNSTFTGEIVDRYRHFDHPGSDPALKLNRGLGYSLLSLYNLTLGAEAAYHHGVDLYHYQSSTGENLKLPGIYYMHYLKTFGPGDTLITPTNYSGENSYTNEILQNDFIKPYELLTYRYDNNVNIANAFSKFTIPTRQRYNPDYLFGKIYRYDQINWDFFLDNISEGWSTPTNIINGGTLQITTRDTTTTLISPPLIIRANDYPVLTLRYKANGGGNHNGTISWGDGKSTNFTVNADGNYHDYNINLSQVTNWNGTITQLKIQPIDLINSTVLIDYIKLHNKNISTNLAGDLNSDGIINHYDFNMLISKFNNPYTMQDFGNIITNFGK